VRYFLIQRLISVLIVFIAVTTLVYLVFFNLPVDPVELLCDRYCTPDLVAELKATLELDGSIFAQLIALFGGIVFGRQMYRGSSIEFYCEAPCLGYSFRNNISVTELLLDRLPATASLAIGSFTIAITFGFGLAVVAVLNLNSRIDRFIQSSAMLLTAVQVYLVGLVVQYLVVFRWQLLPQSGYSPISEDPISWLQSLILPWLTLGLTLAGTFARVIRTKLIEQIPTDHFRTARSLGQSRIRLFRRNLIRPSLGPILALFGVVFGELLGGTVLTEIVFNIPGIGKLSADAVAFLDLPLLVGVLLVSTFFVVLGNFLADLLHYLLDPRIGLTN
jgi:peptide/nickel transport system permease protein